MKVFFRDTNTYAELWFRILKHQILKKKIRLKPSDFVRILYEDMKGRLVNILYKLDISKVLSFKKRNRYFMYMMRNNMDCVDLRECTERDETLTLEEVWRRTKQLPDQKNETSSFKYFAPAEKPKTNSNVHRICFGIKK